MRMIHWLDASGVRTLTAVMPRVPANGIDIEYRSLGDPGAPPMLLIMGLGAQLTRWPEALCRALVDVGYHVIVYDNRDVGLSSRVSDGGRPNLIRAAIRVGLGLPVRAPYTLDDMALDAVGLLDRLGLASAHVVGASMGSMIGQILAAKHGARVRSFVSVMSSSGGREVPQARLGLRLRLLRPVRGTREERIDGTAELLRRISSPAFPPDPAELRRAVARDLERSPDQRGVPRQLLAIMASGSRGSLVRHIQAPTLIIHGAQDPLVPVAAAYDLHQLIPGSRLEIIPGMGHDLPAALIPRVAELIVANARRADAPGREVTPQAAER